LELFINFDLKFTLEGDQKPILIRLPEWDKTNAIVKNIEFLLNDCSWFEIGVKTVEIS